MPGAAALAAFASHTARASGSSQPVTRVIPSLSCLPNHRPRRRARTLSRGSEPSWSIVISSRSATFRNSSGVSLAADLPSSSSARSRSSAATPAGNLAKNFRITRTCSVPISPRAWEAAVAGSFGGSGSPFSARRGPNSSASASRRSASARLIRSECTKMSRIELHPVVCGVSFWAIRVTILWSTATLGARHPLPPGGDPLQVTEREHIVRGRGDLGGKRLIGVVRRQQFLAIEHLATHDSNISSRHCRRQPRDPLPVDEIHAGDNSRTRSTGLTAGTQTGDLGKFATWQILVATVCKHFVSQVTYRRRRA